MILHGLALAALVVQASSTQPSSVPSIPSDVVERIDAYVAPFVDDRQLSGTLLVARGDDVLYERSYGMANWELGVPNTPDTRFCVASVTKPLTQIVVIQLIQEQKLGVQDTLAKWLPDFPSADAITVMHLLSHRAGIPHRVMSDLDEASPRTAADMARLAAQRPLRFTPGEKSVYSSAGYSVLARVAELASGRPFAELLQERVFEPAGMTSSADVVGGRLIEKRASSYLATPDGLRNAPLKHLSFLVGAGSVHSTPRDLFRCVRAIVHRVYGEGVAANALSRGTIAWNGVTNGYRAFVDFDPRTEIAVVFAGNLLTGATDRVRADVPKILAGESVAPPARLAIAKHSIAPEELDRFEGTYDLDGQPLDVRREGTWLWIGDSSLVPTGPSTFFAYRDYGTVEAKRAEDGSVTAFVWHSNGTDLQLPRVHGADPAGPEPTKR